MEQVEGGSLLVIQRGQESSPRREDGRPSKASGWHDGPWWRATGPGSARSINAQQGLVAGTKLVRVSAESYAKEFFEAKGGVEAAAKVATEVLSESNPTRSSDIFLAIQAIREEGKAAGQDGQLFAAGASDNSASEKSGIKEADSAPEEDVVFAIYLHDPIHSIAYSAVSQAVPARWLEWLDASQDNLPESISEIIESGGVDPRQWVAEWVDEVLCLAIGVVAQRYVARRMGVGEGAKGKLKAGINQGEVVNAGGGEAARAVAGL